MSPGQYFFVENSTADWRCNKANEFSTTTTALIEDRSITPQQPTGPGGGYWKCKYGERKYGGMEYTSTENNPRDACISAWLFVLRQCSFWL